MMMPSLPGFHVGNYCPIGALCWWEVNRCSAAVTMRLWEQHNKRKGNCQRSEGLYPSKVHLWRHVRCIYQSNMHTDAVTATFRTCILSWMLSFSVSTSALPSYLSSFFSQHFSLFCSFSLFSSEMRQWLTRTLQSICHFSPFPSPICLFSGSQLNAAGFL